jgi:ADP-heptose:LPS heptosyltransferase
MDRLGDLVCTLPVDQHPSFLKEHFSIQWLISSGLEPVLECAQPKRNFWSESTTFSWSKFWLLVSKLKSKQFDQVILFYAPWWVAAACYFAGIQNRYSPRSRWFQLLFFNQTLKQKRSRSEKHESDYNWELVNWAITGNRNGIQNTPLLNLQSTSPMPPELTKPYFVIHPGMAGSALNWRMADYLKLAEKLIIQLDHDVVITGTRSDLPILSEIEPALKSLKRLRWLVGDLDLAALIKVLSESEAVIAPSTGVIHLAASTGVKTIGIYSPIKVQTPTRWGPRGPKTIAIIPQVSCPAKMKCLGKTCSYYYCLNKITVDQIIEHIKLK